MRFREFQSLSRGKKWSLCRQDDIKRAAVGPKFAGILPLNNQLNHLPLPFFHYCTDNWIACRHFGDQA